jgi:hypothetical protein
MPEKLLQFADLSKRHFGVSDGLSASYAQAARVCLDRHHAPPTEFQMRDNAAKGTAIAKWDKADQRLCYAWANNDDATEAGAYALALAVN